MKHAQCPACAIEHLSAGLFEDICLPCWYAAPPRMRIKLITSRSRRTREPHRYQDAVADLLLWCRERRASIGGDNDGPF